jgi:hypothetical protein
MRCARVIGIAISCLWIVAVVLLLCMSSGPVVTVIHAAVSDDGNQDSELAAVLANAG